MKTNHFLFFCSENRIKVKPKKIIHRVRIVINVCRTTSYYVRAVNLLCLIALLL